ncbi:MAG: triose-phosphate isomerase [Acetobacteraceae bacterium]
MRALVAGNWKMHGTLGRARALAAAVRQGAEAAPPQADLVLCPPALHLPAVAEALAGSAIGLGGQDCHAEAEGPHTGDVSAPMLRDAGAGWVILGHSERRAGHGETDSAVRAKAEAALAAGLTPIVCVGETLEEREAGRAEEVVVVQLAGSVPEGFCAASGVIAYEPVWAIGTGRTPSPADIETMHAAIRAALVARHGAAGKAVRILYGGSVKAANAAQILALRDVNGALVGGASLDAAGFLAIAAAVPAPKEPKGG